MKVCQNCGTQNEDTAKFCASCGNSIVTAAPTDSPMDFNPNNDEINRPPNPGPSLNSQNNQQPPINRPPPTNQQQNPYQQPNYNTHSHKNAWLAVGLDVIGGLIFYFLSGIGHLYLGLIKRGIALCVVGLLISIINMGIMLIFSDTVGSIISLIIGVGFVLYCAYDAKNCAEAINEGRPIPLLFNSLDMQ